MTVIPRWLRLMWIKRDRQVSKFCSVYSLRTDVLMFRDMISSYQMRDYWLLSRDLLIYLLFFLSFQGCQLSLSLSLSLSNSLSVSCGQADSNTVFCLVLSRVALFWSNYLWLSENNTSVNRNIKRVMLSMIGWGRRFPGWHGWLDRDSSLVLVLLFV